MTKLEKAIKELRWLRFNFPWQDNPENNAVKMFYAIYKYTGDAIELLESQQWISVKDRLPEEWESVITFQPSLAGDRGLIRIGVYIGSNKWRECERHDMMDLPVTHWMPMPEGPKEEDSK